MTNGTVKQCRRKLHFFSVSRKVCFRVFNLLISKERQRRLGYDFVVHPEACTLNLWRLAKDLKTWRLNALHGFKSTHYNYIHRPRCTYSAYMYVSPSAHIYMCLAICPDFSMSVCMYDLLVVCWCVYFLSVWQSDCLPAWRSVCLSVCMYVCLSVVWLSICLPVCRSACLLVCLSVCLPFCLSVCLFLSISSVSVCLFLYVCICLTVPPTALPPPPTHRCPCPRACNKWTPVCYAARIIKLGRISDAPHRAGT